MLSGMKGKSNGARGESNTHKKKRVEEGGEGKRGEEGQTKLKKGDD